MTVRDAATRYLAEVEAHRAWEARLREGPPNRGGYGLAMEHEHRCVRHAAVARALAALVSLALEAPPDPPDALATLRAQIEARMQRHITSIGALYCVEYGASARAAECAAILECMGEEEN